MKKVNKHGLKMVGLRKAASSTEDYGDYSPMYNELFYNVRTGEVWTVFQYCLGQNSWTVYLDSDILKICNTTSHMTMQQIADLIYESV